MKATIIIFLLGCCGQTFAQDVWRGRVLYDLDAGDQEHFAVVKRFALLPLPGHPKLEIAGGLLRHQSVHRGLVHIGPAWQWMRNTNYGAFVWEFTFTPTLLSGGKLGDRDLGGVFHFTSGVGVGWRPRNNSPLYLGLRLQHTSNGSAHRRNPGLDALGLEFTYQFR